MVWTVRSGPSGNLVYIYIYSIYISYIYIYGKIRRGGCTEGGWLGMLAVRDACILHQESSLQVSSCASFNVGLLCSM